MPEQVYIVRHGHICARRSRLVIKYETVGDAVPKLYPNKEAAESAARALAAQELAVEGEPVKLWFLAGDMDDFDFGDFFEVATVPLEGDEPAESAP
jgi:hypothetical protein